MRLVSQHGELTPTHTACHIKPSPPTMKQTRGPLLEGSSMAMSGVNLTQTNRPPFGSGEAREPMSDKKTTENLIGKGKAGPGRPKGVPNKSTAVAKEALQTVFDNLGGVEALERWVKSDPDNEKAFYVQVWPKLLPLQVNGAGADGEHIHAIKWID